MDEAKIAIILEGDSVSNLQRLTYGKLNEQVQFKV